MNEPVARWVLQMTTPDAVVTITVVVTGKATMTEASLAEDWLWKLRHQVAAFIRSGEMQQHNAEDP